MNLPLRSALGGSKATNIESRSSSLFKNFPNAFSIPGHLPALREISPSKSKKPRHIASNVLSASQHNLRSTELAIHLDGLNQKLIDIPALSHQIESRFERLLIQLIQLRFLLALAPGLHERNTGIVLLVRESVFAICSINISESIYHIHPSIDCS